MSLGALMIDLAGSSVTAEERELLRHPLVEKPVLLRRASDSGNGAVNLADTFPTLSGNGSYPLEPLNWASLKKQGCSTSQSPAPATASPSITLSGYTATATGTAMCSPS